MRQELTGALFAPRPRAARLRPGLFTLCILGAWLALYATAKGADPGPPPATTQAAKPGASALFGALAEPDRVAEIAALRSLRLTLAQPADPAALESSRAQVETLLELEERRQPEVPPAIVMSALAARIDTALAGLEQAARGAALLHGWQGAAVALAAATACAALGAGLAVAGLGRARVRDTLRAATDSLSAASARLESASVSVSGGQKAATEAAAAAAAADASARDSAAAVTRLARAARDVGSRIAAGLENMEARQATLTEASARTEAVVRDLPALIAGALETLEACGLPAIEAAVARLADGADGVAAAVVALEAGMAGLTSGKEMQQALEDALERVEAFSALLPDITARLAGSIAALRREAPVASPPPREEAALAADVEPHAPAPADAIPPEAMAAQAAALEDALNRADGFARLLPDITATLAATIADARREAKEGALALAAACSDLCTSASAAAALRRGAEDAVGRLQAAAGATQAAADQVVSAADQMARDAADRGRAAAAVAGLTDAAAKLRESAAALATEAESRQAVLQDWAGRAEAAVATLPAEAGQLAAAAHAMREDAGAIQAAAWRMEAASAGEAALIAGLQESVRALGEICVRVDGCTAGLANTAVTLRDESDAVRQAAPIACLQDSLHTLAETCTRVNNSTAGLEQAATALRDDAHAVRHAALSGTEDLRAAAGSVRQLAETPPAWPTPPAPSPAADTLADLRASFGIHSADLGALLTKAEDVMARFATALETSHDAAASREPPTPALDAEHMAQLQQAAQAVESAAARLAIQAEAQDEACARVASAAKSVAAAAAPQEIAPTLACLSGLASQTRRLQQVAGALANDAVLGNIGAVPTNLAADLPAVLAVIETAIGGLQSTATALALAGDAVRLAA
jgi:hypothetical protein